MGRRCFFLIGTLYMYRCVTMYITTLPVPGKHMVCAPKVHTSVFVYQRIYLQHTFTCGLHTVDLFVCLRAAVQRLDGENLEDTEADLRWR